MLINALTVLSNLILINVLLKSFIFFNENVLNKNKKYTLIICLPIISVVVGLLFPEENLLILVICLILLGSFVTRSDFSIILFTVLFSTTIILFQLMIFLGIISFIVGVIAGYFSIGEIFEGEMQPLILMISYLINLIISWLLLSLILRKKRNSLKKVGYYLFEKENRRILILLNVLLILTSLLIMSNQLFYQLSEVFSEITVVLVFFAMVLFLIVGVIIFVKQLVQNKNKEMQKQQFENLQEYTKQIESMYDEIRSFRHDYINIVRSLDLGIKTGDIKTIQHVYDNLVQPSGTRLSEMDFTLTKLINMEISEIKSLLVAKVITAQTNNIEVKIEMFAPVLSCHVPILDYYRLISIILDNAIEAATQSDGKIIWITFIVESEELIAIISNTTKEGSININRLGEKGISTKGAGRGIGLYNVEKIVRTNSNMLLDTTSEEYRFTQTIITKRAAK